MGGLDNSLKNSEVLDPEDQEYEPLINGRKRKVLKIKGDENLLTIEDSEESVVNQLESIDMDYALERVEGNKKYFMRILLQGALSMFAASATTYALGYYEAEPLFFCE